MFLHAVDTGLQDEATRNRLRPLLQTSDVQDEHLIQRMNEIVLEKKREKVKTGIFHSSREQKLMRCMRGKWWEGPHNNKKQLKRTYKVPRERIARKIKSWPHYRWSVLNLLL